MFPSDQNNNNNQYMDFDFSDEILPKDHNIVLHDPFVQQQYYSSDHHMGVDQNQNQTSTHVVLDFMNPTGAGAWPTNQPESDSLPPAASEKQKKVSHKEIERQRRQEMAKLHSSLRGLLPLEYIKGKRSMADHMSEAVNYICHLQNRIKELKKRKDEIMVKGGGGAAGSSSSSSTCRAMNIVSVNPCFNGIQVLISCDQSTGDQVLLSKVMQVLVEEGHDIVTCVSHFVDTKLFHTINTEVNHPSEIGDLIMLQQRLSYVINSNS